MVTQGAIIGLDVKLAATLLKTMTLLDWHQIGMCAAISAIRFMITQAFRRAQQEEMLEEKVCAPPLRQGRFPRH
jgi:uncharacterized membrane protein YjfL (UPF0719 family)